MPGRTNPPPSISKPGFTLVERRQWDAPTPLRLWHVASLDAPTVALVWSCTFSWAAHIRVPGWAPVALAPIAWAVHTADRLFDARAGFAPPARLAALGGLLVAEAWKAGQPQALQR